MWTECGIQWIDNYLFLFYFQNFFPFNIKAQKVVIETVCKYCILEGNLEFLKSSYDKTV
jgi:hypothetical protein